MQLASGKAPTSEAIKYTHVGRRRQLEDQHCQIAVFPFSESAAKPFACAAVDAFCVALVFHAARESRKDSSLTGRHCVEGLGSRAPPPSLPHGTRQTHVRPDTEVRTGKSMLRSSWRRDAERCGSINTHTVTCAMVCCGPATDAVFTDVTR